MSNVSLKEQLEAVASQLSANPHTNKFKHEHKPKPYQPLDKSKKTKPKWLDYVEYGVELLRAYFPNTFKPTSEIKPLKVGIKQDLLIRLSSMDNIVTDDKACMVKSLSYYVNMSSYHRSVVEGVVRIDLEGHPAGIVTPEEAQYSLEKHKLKLSAKGTNKPQSV